MYFRAISFIPIPRNNKKSNNAIQSALFPSTGSSKKYKIKYPNVAMNIAFRIALDAVAPT